MAGEFVINGAKLECSLCSTEGKLTVTSTPVMLQDKTWATEADNTKQNLVFEGVCKKFKKNPPPCKSVIAPTSWQNNANGVEIDDQIALVEGSTIKCSTGNVDITITDTMQKDEPTELPDIPEIPKIIKLEGPFEV